MDSMEKGRGPGGIEGMGDETREFLAISGGDGDNTGVYPPLTRTGRSEPTSDQSGGRDKPFPEEERWPSRSEYWTD